MTIDHPAAQQLLSIIRHRIVNHPRSQQVRIGPSEIGHPCTRWIGYKLAMNGAEMNPRSAGWRPTVGTAVHSWLADTFEEANARLEPVIGAPVWMVENRLLCGEVEGPDGYDVYGSCDVFDVPNRIAIDWKIVGNTTLKEARKHGPAGNYRVQAHAYGRGWRRRGFPVDEVAVFYLPVAGELSDAVWWSEPYDEAAVTTALARVSTVQQLVKQHGLGVVEHLPTADHYCNRCPFFKPGSTDLRTGCPGDEERPVRQDAIHKLIAPAKDSK